MKSFLKLIVSLVLWMICLSITEAKPVTRHALLVGVGTYNTDTGWNQLNAANDVKLISETLINRGFRKKNIHTLIDQEVTRASLVNAVKKLLLRKIKKGDLVVFHYSGHGQQVKDNNGDEIDGLDEAIVPFDSPKNYEAGIYEGEKLIRDEELGELFLMLRESLGPEGHLLVIMDACHSGTGTRGLREARGTDIVMAPKDYVLNLDLNTRDIQQLDDIIRLKNHATMVSLFSSAARQMSYEMKGEDGKSYGLFTYAFSKFFNELSSSATYEALMGNIKTFMASQTSLQTPQIEGSQELTVLGGKLLAKADYFQAIDWLNESTVLLGEGNFHGLHNGTIVAFYPADSRKTNRQSPLSYGEISFSKAFLSEIELETPLDKKTAMSSWIFVEEKSYGSLSLKLINALPDLEAYDEIREQVGIEKAIQLVEQDADLIVKEHNGFLQLLNADNKLLFEEKNPTSNEVIAHCLLSAQAKYLRTLEIEDDRLKGELRLYQEQETKEIFNVGDQLTIEIKNTGSAAFYFSVLEIRPDNILNAVPIAGDNRSDEEYYLEPGESFTSQSMEIIEPIGTEFFKLIMTPEPINLSALIDSKSMVTRGLTTGISIEALLTGTKNGPVTRGASTMRVGAAGVSTKIFQIKRE